MKSVDLRRALRPWSLLATVTGTGSKWPLKISAELEEESKVICCFYLCLFVARKTFTASSSSCSLLMFE